MNISCIMKINNENMTIQRKVLNYARTKIYQKGLGAF